MSAGKVTDPESQPLTPMLIRHGWKGVLPFVTVTAIVLAGSLFWPKTYKAEATFEIRNKAAMRQILGGDQPAPELKQTLAQDVAGRLAIEQVIDDLDLIEAQGTEAQAAAVYQADRQRLGEQLFEVTRVHLDLFTPEVQRVRVTVEHDHPSQARDVANRLVENYIERGRQRARENGNKRAALLQSQVDRYTEELQAAQAQLTAFEMKYPIPGIISPSRWQDMQVQSAWKLMTAQVRDQSAAERLERIARSVGANADDTSRSNVFDEGERSRLQRLLLTCRDQLDLATGLQGLGADHRKVQALQEQIRQIEDRLLEIPKKGMLLTKDGKALNPDADLTQAWQEQQAAAEELRIAQQHASVLEQESGRLAPVADEFRTLKRGVEAIQSNLAFWEGHLLTARRTLSEDMLRQEEAISFLSPAAELQFPKAPLRQQILFAAVGSGLAAGALFIFLAMQGDTSYRQLQDAEQSLPIPILGELGLDNQQPLAARMWQLGVWRPVGAAIGIGTIGILLNLSFARLSAPGNLDGVRQNRTAIQEGIDYVPDSRSIELPVAGEPSEAPMLRYSSDYPALSAAGQ